MRHRSKQQYDLLGTEHELEAVRQLASQCTLHRTDNPYGLEILKGMEGYG